MNSLKVIISAYACEPGTGSEPGVGWNIVTQMAKYHQVWVITRANNRSKIEKEIPNNSISNPQFVYYDLPSWAMWWKKRAHGIQIYYYIWQIGIFFIARKLHTEIAFDVAHHITFVKYSSPSLLSLLRIPFIWGPVGGGESTPKAFFKDLGFRGRLYEVMRETARFIGKWDPLVRMTARNSKLSLATTAETAACLEWLGSKAVRNLGESGLSEPDCFRLSSLPQQVGATLRFISLGRLIHWKGFHLGLRAFAGAAIPDAEYWIVGDGPELTKLKGLVAQLKISDRVYFLGALPRSKGLEKLGECHVLVHPSLHDSGGWVCLEAMAAGRPVVCLNLGGPATQVTTDTGFKIPAVTPKQVVADMTKIMIRLAKDPALRERMGKAGRELVAREYSWDRKGEILSGYYAEVTGR